VRRQQVISYWVGSHVDGHGRTSLRIRNGATVVSWTERPMARGRARNYLTQVRKIDSCLAPGTGTDSFTLFFFGHGPNAFPLSARRAVLPFANKVLRRHDCECKARSETINSWHFHLKRGGSVP
jgi:hypothetical protein